MKAFTAFLAVILLLTLAGIRRASARATIEIIDFFTTKVVNTRSGHEGPKTA